MLELMEQGRELLQLLASDLVNSLKLRLMCAAFLAGHRNCSLPSLVLMVTQMEQNRLRLLHEMRVWKLCTQVFD